MVEVLTNDFDGDLVEVLVVKTAIGVLCREILEIVTEPRIYPTRAYKRFLHFFFNMIYNLCISA